MGSFGSYLKKPITEKISSDEANETLRIGVSSMQGWRLTQEDAHNCLIDFDVNTAYFAVYDGHGGVDVAQYCSLKLPEFIKNTEAYKNDDLELALTEGFLGFDATIPTPEVLAKLKDIAKDNVPEPESDSSDVEENVSNLYEEASMPLEKVIEKYKHCLKDEHLQLVTSTKHNKCSNSSTKSIPNSDSIEAGECSVSSSSNVKGSPKVETSGVCDTTRKANSTSEEKESDVGSSKSNENEVLIEQPNQNGEVTSPSSEAEKVRQENGEISKKGKGKATTKTKGVKESTPIKTRPRRTAQELYNKILNPESDSESEDEEDKTFQGPNVDCSSDDDDDENAEDCWDESSEVDEEADHEEDEDEEEEDEEDDEGEEYLASREDLDVAMVDKPGYYSGCTAVVALLKGYQLFVANAGDSRCIVCRKGQAIEMSLDHKPEDKIERERIKKAGGFVQCGRVDGGLNLSRAIGDYQYKQNKDLTDREQKIIALPDVRTLTINPKEDEFMVLACDGIWNSMSSQEVVDFVKPKIDSNPENLSKICEEMFENCLAPNTLSDGTGCDNMTAILIQFKCTKRAASFDESESENSKRVKTDETVSESEVAA